LKEVMEAADELASLGWSSTIADARFAKPIDESLILNLARDHEVLITIEEGSIGGFASHVMQFLANKGLFDRGLKFRAMTLPDIFIDHDKPEIQYAIAGLKRSDIVSVALKAVGEDARLRLDVSPASA